MLYVVYDRQGAGRLVGIFDDRTVADRVAAVYPPYYEVLECEANAITPAALSWLPNDELRRKLAAIAKRLGR